MKRVSLVAALLAAATATGAAHAEDARSASVSAALPVEVDGYAKGSDDVIDASGTPPALTVVRLYSGGAGMIQVQVRLWALAETAEEAAIMADPATLQTFDGQPVDLMGHKGSFVNNVLTLYPGLPNEGITVSVGPHADLEVLKAFANKIGYDALIAIE